MTKNIKCVMQKLSDLYSRFGWEFDTIDFNFNPHRKGEAKVIAGIECYPMIDNYTSQLLKKSYDRAVQTFADRALQSLETFLNGVYTRLYGNDGDQKSVVTAVKALCFIEDNAKREEFVDSLVENGTNLDKVIVIAESSKTENLADSITRHGANLDFILAILEASISVSSVNIDYAELSNLTMEEINELSEFYLSFYLNKEAVKEKEEATEEPLTSVTDLEEASTAQ